MCDDASNMMDVCLDGEHFCIIVMDNNTNMSYLLDI